jgi:mono/diheme cytochrome c family protein
MKKGLLTSSAAVVLALASAYAADAPKTDPPVNFAREILPLLSENCFTCHGPDEKARKGKLRLDTQDGAFRKNDPVIIAGKSKESEVVKRVSSKDPEEMMPPPKSKKTLTAKQIELLSRWIDQGAPWGKHWAFEAPVRPEPPAVANKAWAKNPIDQFVLARLEKEGLKPSPEAAKETLIRRVTLDLTGLPPTPAEVDAFLADNAPDAYEKLVDRMLASPRYGERMAWDWLDAARYADTNGYQGDGERTMWPWRDWVVKSFNDNKHYDTFTIEQLAGDLLPNATLEQKIATGFNRNHMINGEGGRIGAENRVDYVMDQTETTSTIWLGVTMTCCRCHDHKYDPFLQKDYYSLFAFFNNSPVSGDGGSGKTAPVVDFTSPAEEAKMAEMKAKEDAANKEYDALEKTIKEAQPEWEKSILGAQSDGKAPEIKWQVLMPDELFSDGGSTLTKTDDGAVLVSGQNPAKDSFVVNIKSKLVGITAFKLEALPDASFVNKGPGRADNGNFVLSEIKLQGSGKPVDLVAVSADFEQQGLPLANAVDGKNDTGWAVMPEFGKVHTAIFEAKNQVGYGSGETLLAFRLEFQTKHIQHVLGKFRLSATTDNRTLLHPMPENIRTALGVAADKRNDKQKKELTEFYLNTHAGLATAKATREAAKKAREGFQNSVARVMVMADSKVRDTFVLVRGAYDKPADKVTINTPSPLPPMAPDAPKNRLGLAQWLVSPTQPLTSRVTVNRIWQAFFGIGIAKTPEDFGVQGERPVHPELLDWLATEFIRTGWDTKAFQKLIVTSATYRQSSKTTKDLTERDPQNRLLARGPRYRLPSWMLRDQALAVSGLLVEKMGGPSVKPYQPPGLWEEATFGTISYKQDHGDALYRRSLYIFWRRILGPTVFFDNAARQTCSVKGYLTNTPLQALTTLNDITYVEAARALAQRVIADAKDPEGRVELAFRLATGRKPKAAENEILLSRLKKLREEFDKDTQAAQKLLKVGESKRDEKINPAEQAAYTGVCSLILNLDETVTKE